MKLLERIKEDKALIKECLGVCDKVVIICSKTKVLIVRPFNDKRVTKYRNDYGRELENGICSKDCNSN